MFGISVKQSGFREVGRGHVSHGKGTLLSMTSLEEREQVSCFSTGGEENRFSGPDER